MKINVLNKEKVEKEIKSTESRAQVRFISYEDINDAINHIEKRLSNLMHKKDWVGLKFLIDPNAQTFPGSYKGVPESTQVVLERCASGWFVVRCFRGCVCTNGIMPQNIESKNEQIAAFLALDKAWN